MKKVLIGVGIVIVVAAVVILALRVFIPEDTWICDNGQWVKHGNPSADKPTAGCSSSATNTGTDKSKDKAQKSGEVLAQVAATNKFGWLGAGEDGTDMDFIRNAGGGWMRPHPGPAVWDMVQASSSAQYDFTKMDELVSLTGSYGLNLLITLWPFAEWDQLGRADAASCAVSSNDEFLPSNDKKGRPSYLPLHRCNPYDWKEYQGWISAVVERYDGDGLGDMTGLLYPIKYWEVMNEPDLIDMGDGRLDFYKQDAAAYGELLVRTYTAVKAADSTANVLIAGAAGGGETFLGFYSSVFAGVPASKSSFDIGNVHCISNDRNTPDFNVADYKAMLTSAGITDKSIWVTEAEQMDGKTFDQNVSRIQTSVANALAAGAKKIFFTRYDFGDTRTDMSQKYIPTEEDMERSRQAYKDVITATP
ncbi:MAG: hypothetical protein V1668_02970 [Patescibacteria group bacterium]